VKLGNTDQLNRLKAYQAMNNAQATRFSGEEKPEMKAKASGLKFGSEEKPKEGEMGARLSLKA
jgi:hypothetical protein